jgi:propionate CoA-transferase
VFQLTSEGVELVEYAPGIDLQRDVLDRMGFTPVIRQPRIMDARFFQ